MFLVTCMIDEISVMKISKACRQSMNKAALLTHTSSGMIYIWLLIKGTKITHKIVDIIKQASQSKKNPRKYKVVSINDDELSNVEPSRCQ